MNRIAVLAFVLIGTAATLGAESMPGQAISPAMTTLVRVGLPNGETWIVPALALAVIGAAVAPRAELGTKRVLTLDLAKGIAAAAENYAKERNWKVNIAIMDDGANLLYFQRMLGVQIGSIDVSIKKAESAVKFMRPTKAFSDAISARPGLAMLPGALAVEGGLPIIWQGEVLGAIGISGLTSEQDGMVAKAGVDALETILSPSKQDGPRQP